jgi:5'-3' exonuclease
VDDRVTVWSPTKKKMYTPETLTEEYGITPNNFLMFKMLVGDVSDGIPGIKGIGLKSILKRFPIMLEEEEVTIDKLLKYSDKQLKILDEKGKQVNNYKIYKDVLASKDKLVLNDDLIQLRKVDITRNTKILLSNQMKRPINRLIKHHFLRLVLEDKMNVGLRNPDLWLRETFTQLDAYASETHE